MPVQDSEQEGPEQAPAGQICRLAGRGRLFQGQRTRSLAARRRNTRFQGGAAVLKGDTLSIPSGRTSVASRTQTLEVGDPAPDFELEEHRSNTPVSLRSFRGKKNVVLVFYPLDWTSV
jgi:hypothetical protein